MNWKKHIIEAVTLIGAAVICALVANGVASTERKLNVGPAESFAAPPPSQSGANGAGQPPPAVQTLPTATAETTSVAATPVPVAPKKTVTVKTDSGGPLSSTSAPAPAPAPVAPPKEFKPHPDKAYIEIGYADVAALHKMGALFLDARRTSVYEQGHITGARPFSVWESDIDQKINKLFEERGDPREQEKPIVAYCSGGDCEDSHMLAQKLWGIQFNNVYVYKDGFPDWQKRGGAVHTGATP
jgi:rhodanese-related sulfurtransferase